VGRRARARRRGEGPAPLALERGIGVIVWAPLASGFLTDGFDTDALEADDFRRAHRFASLDLTAVRNELRSRGGGGVTVGALRFVLSHPAVTGAIVGVRDEREGRELAQLHQAAAPAGPAPPHGSASRATP